MTNYKEQTVILSFIKRLFDILFSFLLIIILCPFLTLIVIAIKMDSKGPILFKQKRIMRGKREFFIFKFRTMKVDTPKDVPTHMLENPDSYITKVGKILRHTSLDELPQLLNILKGEMSFVGPRPALWNQFDLIEEREKYGANDIPVGLTGWAQINERDDLPIPVKAKYDGEYVQRMNLVFDVIIIFKTVFYAIAGKGITEGSH